MRSARNAKRAAAEGGQVAAAVSLQSASQRAKCASLIGSGRCAASGLPWYRPVISATDDQNSMMRVRWDFPVRHPHKDGAENRIPAGGCIEAPHLKGDQRLADAGLVADSGSIL